MKATMSMQMLKRSYQLVSVGNKAEIRDTARLGKVVFAGTYAQCVKHAKLIGIWYS